MICLANQLHRNDRNFRERRKLDSVGKHHKRGDYHQLQAIWANNEETWARPLCLSSPNFPNFNSRENLTVAQTFLKVLTPTPSIPRPTWRFPGGRPRRLRLCCTMPLALPPASRVASAPSPAKRRLTFGQPPRDLTNNDSRPLDGLLSCRSGWPVHGRGGVDAVARGRRRADIPEAQPSRSNRKRRPVPQSCGKCARRSRCARGAHTGKCREWGHVGESPPRTERSARRRSENVRAVRARR